MGLPEINITFSSLATSAVKRSGRGVVALVLRDDTDITFTVKEYSVVTDVDSADYTAINLQYIKDAFLGTPSKVIVVRGDTTDVDYNTELATLATKKFNYLAIPGIISADVTTVVSWLKTQRDTNKKTYKAVLPNATTADHEGIINFATDNIVVGSNTYTASQYSARVAGVLAGISLERSATYYVLSEVDSVPALTVTEANTAIEAGKLILLGDGEKVKISRGVNSFTTTSTSKSADFKKIKVIEGHDIVTDDITTTWNDNYVGKIVNSYDNQVLFLTSVNAYIKGLQGTVLDPNADNYVTVDVDAQRAAWEAAGTSTSELTDEQVKEKSFGSSVFLSGSLKFLDAAEDLTFKINV